MKISRDRLKDYAASNTGMLAATTPLYGLMEVTLGGMAPMESAKSRLQIVGLTLSGLGYGYVKLRDFSRQVFGVTAESSPRKKVVHDGAYSTAFNLAVSIPIYLNAGAELDEALRGTAGCMALGLTIGPITGYAVDRFRDLAHVPHKNESPRVRNLSPRTRAAIAGVAVAASLGLTGLVYQATSGSEPPITTIPAEPTQ